MCFECKPVAAWMNVNRICQLRCQWCYGEGTHYKPDQTMSLELARELVEISIEAGVKKFILIGGEPTLWPHLFDFNRFCKDKGVDTCIITNAIRFADDEFLAKYKEHPCDTMSVSVKSVDPVEFQKVTRSNMFLETIEGIKRAIDLGGNVSTVHNTLVGTSGLIQIAKQCKDMGAKTFSVDICNATISDDGVAEKGFSFEPHQVSEEIMKFHPILDKIYNGHIGIEIYVPLCLFPDQFVSQLFKNQQIGTMCHMYSRNGIIYDTNGNVIPCNGMFNTVIAEKKNFYNGQSLLGILNQKKLKEQYKELLRYPSIECNNCCWERECRGGCLINWMVFNPSEICCKIPKERR